MLPIIDTATLLRVVIGLIIGILESKGLLDRAQHNTNAETAQVVIGGLIILASELWGMIHHTIIEKQKISQGVEIKPYSLQPLFDKLRGLSIFEKSKPVVEEQQQS